MTSPHNLPLQLTSLIGRDAEVREVRRLMTGTHLLTLSGAGGVGKTRLALQVASEELATFLDGVWFVELASLADPSLIPSTIASAVGAHEEPNRPMLATLGDHFRAKCALIVLDNCEHLIADAAQVCETLLRAAPQLKILATSREALDIAGETAYRVPSLPVPADSMPIQALPQVASVRLFVERSQAARSDFVLTDANAPAVAQICRRLDGIPFALELAAARINALTPEQIAVRLDDRFHLLTGGSRTALPRHRTLRATVDWSYNLLTEPERLLLRRLSVFVGGWTLEAAEQVCALDAGAPPTLAFSDVLDLLSQLVGKSLVVAEARDGSGAAMRYRLLETIRQYAREKLDTSGELPATRDRHLAYFLKLAEQASPNLLAADPECLRRTETEYDNLREALAHAIATNPESALRLAMSLKWFWEWHERVQEGYRWVLQLLPLTEAWGPGALRARALGLAGFVAMDVPDREAALAFLQASLAMARDAQDKYQIAWDLYCLAVSAWHAGDWPQMRQYAEESRPLFEELGIPWGVCNSYWQLGQVAYKCGDYESARALFEQSLTIARSAGFNSVMTFALDSLGDVARVQGDYARARAAYTEELQLKRQMGWRQGIALALVMLGQVALHGGEGNEARDLFLESLTLVRDRATAGQLRRILEGLAGVAGVEGRYEECARLFGAADASRRATGTAMSQLDSKEYHRILAIVRERMDDGAFNAAWAEGGRMILEQAIAEARLVTAAALATRYEPAPQPAYPAGLSAREIEVLRWLARGLTDAEIAEQLVIGRRTVNSHLRAIYNKLDVTTRTAAVRYALDHKLV